jgi:hypothetical protein
VRARAKTTLDLFFCRQCGAPKYETEAGPVIMGQHRPRQRELCCGHRIAWAQSPLGLLGGQRYLDGKVV